MKSYAICNRKGGCGKSATAQAFSNWLSLNGFRTLLVDVDNQANTSYSMGYDTEANSDIVTMFDVLAGKASMKEVVQPVLKRLGNGLTAPDMYWSIAPAEEKLTVFDSGIMPVKTTLKDALQSVADDYDYCVIDTPLSKGLITTSALVASDEVIIPCVAEIYSVQGAQSIAKSIPAAMKYNPGLKVAGILITRHSDRLSIAKDITDMINATASMIGTKVFDTKIREGIAVREANAYRMGLFDYDVKRRSVASVDYEKFFNELMKGVK